MIAALIRKDVTLFFRNRFFAVVTALALVFYAGAYLAMPDTVNQTLRLAVFAPVLPLALEQAQEQGLSLSRFESESELLEAVESRDYEAGIVFPSDAASGIGTAERVQVQVYFDGSVPEEIQEAVTTLLEELAFLQAGRSLAIETDTEVLGVDRVGAQIPMRDRLLPLFAVLIVLVETLGLASLISEEIESGTIRALLVTPLSVGGLFSAKAVTGTGLAFSQALIFMAATGNLNESPLIITTALLLGGVLVTGIGFLLASLGRDLTSVMAWGVPVLLLLTLPSFSVVFPGTLSDWIRVVPSYYLVDTVHLAANLDAGWTDVGLNLLALAGFDLLFILLGVNALRRRIR
ncbi:MAG: ABC transporter permease [Candidatus Promineifilaceae bacterium]|nr:ABC transporter permease [Candidatus Promineifilaceae bacterium]